MPESILLEFFSSLEKQTFNDFKIIVVNDGYPSFETVASRFEKLDIYELASKNTPSKNRELGINYVKNAGFDILIFGDSDDYFENNRIETTIRLLGESDIVVNDLTLFDANGIREPKYLSHRLQNLATIDLDFIKDKNIFGLSNTGVKTSVLDTLEFDDDLIAIDWYLFSLLLLKGAKAVFSNETQTFYRQYEHNTVGLSAVSKDQFEKGIRIKRKHYTLMREFDISYAKLYNDNETDALKYDPNHLQQISFPLWWEYKGYE